MEQSNTSNLTIPCPYCGGIGTLKKSSIIYGKDYGLVYVCENYPNCDSFVGVHKGTTKPLGTLANAELRDYRKQCHAAFDNLWRSRLINKVYHVYIPHTTNRQKAYIWMASVLQLEEDQSHIAMLGIEQCKRLLTEIQAAVDRVEK